jgi:hypothetical protein
MTLLIHLAQESTPAVSGFDWAALFAAIAAVTGIVAIVMNSVRQRNQQSWESEQEKLRRDWDADQEANRIEWEYSQLVSTRWDELKRELYVSFLGAFDELLTIQEQMGHLRQDLAEDLVNRLGHIERAYEERPPEALKLAQKEGTESKFWQELYEGERDAVTEELRELRPKEQSARRALSKSLSELRLLSSEGILERVEKLSDIKDEYHQWGRPWERRQELDRIRSELIGFIRRDLQIDRPPG